MRLTNKRRESTQWLAGSRNGTSKQEFNFSNHCKYTQKFI